MAKIKVAVLGTVGRSVTINPDATIGATIGTDLFMPSGALATQATLLAYLGITGSGSGGGVTAHRLLEGLTLGDDHPQYLRKDTLTTRGDIYARGAATVQRLGVGTTAQLLRSDGTDPVWATISPVITLSTDLSGNTTLTNLASGTLAATIVANAVTDAKLRQSAALTVVGRATNSTGNVADIAAGSDGDVLRRSGTTLGFGTIPQSSVINLVTDLAGKVPVTRTLTAGTGLTGGGDLSADRTFNVGAGTGITVNADDVAISTNGVTNALFRQSAGLTIVGRASNTTGDVADILAAADDRILRRTGSALDFGQLTVGMFPANVVTYAKIQQVSATSRVLGRITTGAGDIEELTGANLATIIGTSLGANPSASVSLTAVNGSAGTYMRSDGAPALSQSIAPTWTGIHTFSPSAAASTAIFANGKDDTYTVVVAGSSTSAKSYGVLITAGTTSADAALNVRNIATRNYLTVRGDGVITLGNTTDNPAYNFTGTGTAQFDGKVFIANGTISNPSFAFANAPSSGLFLNSASDNDFIIVSNGKRVLRATQAGGTNTRFDMYGGDGTSATNTMIVSNQTNTLVIYQMKGDGQVQSADGVVGAPSQSYISDTDTGRYRIGSNNMGDAVGGALIVDYAAARVSFQIPLRLKGYTVAALPAGVAGDTAYVTNALAPAFGAAVAGGGAVTIPVFYDGANWIVG